jgi:hypothetical protein
MPLDFAGRALGLLVPFLATFEDELLEAEFDVRQQYWLAVDIPLSRTEALAVRMRKDEAQINMPSADTGLHPNVGVL